MQNPPNILDLFRRPVRTLPSEGPGSEPTGSADPIQVPRRGAEWIGTVPPPGTVPPGNPAIHDEIEREIFRAQRLAAPGPAPVPRYHRLYDSAGVEEAWQYTIDCSVAGTVTPANAPGATAAVTIPATMLQSALGPITKLSAFPGAVLLYLVVRSFSIAPTAATMTGAYDVTFLSGTGDVCPLVVTSAANTENVECARRLATPWTDASLNGGNLGTLVVLGNTIAAAVACVWRLGFAFAYKIPTLEEYIGGEQ